MLISTEQYIFIGIQWGKMLVQFNYQLLIKPLLKYHLCLPAISSTIIIGTIYLLVREFIDRHSNSCFNSYGVYLQFDECQVMFIICNNFDIAFLYTRRKNSTCSPSIIIMYLSINHI